jgi:hypothetical protein
MKLSDEFKVQEYYGAFRDFGEFMRSLGGVDEVPEPDADSSDWYRFHYEAWKASQAGAPCLPSP